MAALAAVLADAPENPMVSEWICLQSRGMKQWVTASLADNFGVSANTAFVFPKQVVAHVLSSVRDPDDGKPAINDSFFFWSVLDQLMKNDITKDFSQVSSYIKNDDTGKKKFQLAKRMATLFDDYMMYRSDMLMDWEKSETILTSGDPETVFQAAFWKQAVDGLCGPHIAFEIDRFLKNSNGAGFDKKNLPDRISFFGISALPPVFLQVIEKISNVIDIYLFLLVPSNLFFFDMKSKRQEQKEAIKSQTHEETDLETSLETGLGIGLANGMKIGPANELANELANEFFPEEMANPLLSSLGTSGQHFLKQIETYNYHEPGPELFFDPLMENTIEEKSMLAVLQSDILNCVHRKSETMDPPISVQKNDTSVCIHACHSPMREAQVIKDLLLDTFAGHSDIAPHDIIVMMPDIESYAPFIESVFFLEDRLPFSITDRKKRSESESLAAFLSILALQGARLEQKQVLDIMAFESVAKKFGFETIDLTNIEKMLTDANILWGKDGAHREGFGMPGYKENTWQFGLERLFLGMAMPGHHQVPIQDVLPCASFEGSDLEVLGKLSRFCNAFFSCLKSLDQPRSIEKWCGTLMDISETMIGQNAQNNSDMAFLYQQIDEIRTGALAAGFEEKLPFDVIQSLIIQQLDLKVSQGKFLAGKITFCNIMPMRSIPYKVVILMGMDEAAFPRQVFGPGFNLMKKNVRLGDKNERLEDRYLFLETLLSVRQKMIITYTGLDIRDNSPIPCSGVVSELMDVMADSFEFPDGYAYHVSHPLHPFNAAYFKDGGPFFSFSADNFHISTALQKATYLQSTLGKPSFIQPTEIENMPANINSQQPGFERQIEPAPIISMDEFIRYFRHPVEWMVKRHLKIVFPKNESDIRDRENFSLDGLDQYALGSWLIEKQAQPENRNDFYPTLKAMGSLPYGKKGKAEYQKLQLLAGPVMEAAQPIFSKKILLPIVQQVKIEDLTINVHLKDIRQDGLTIVSFGKLNSARLLFAWIQHLFLNVCANETYPARTRLIGRDPNGKKQVSVIEFEPCQERALQDLKGLAAAYNKGMRQPLCFFCGTAFQFVKVMAKHNFDMDKDAIVDAMNQSKKIWDGGYLRSGEKENRYIDLCFSNNDPFESPERFKASGFIDNALMVFKPMFKNMKVVS